jgi:hypothetical protein
MTTATKPKKKNPLDEFAELQDAYDDARQKHSELSKRLHAKHIALEGSDRNTGGLNQQLHKLRVRDPEQFTPDETPVGPEAKRIQAAIDEVGDLAPIVTERDHARLVKEKAKRDLDAHIAAHLDAILDATDSEAVAAAVNAAIDNLRGTLDDYVAHTQRLAGLLAIGGRDNRIDGADQAAELRRTVERLTLPTPGPRR